MRLILIVFVAFFMQIKSEPIPTENTDVKSSATSESVAESNSKLDNANATTASPTAKSNKEADDEMNPPPVFNSATLNKLLELENKSTKTEVIFLSIFL